jgi:hypothetical protein
MKRFMMPPGLPVRDAAEAKVYLIPALKSPALHDKFKRGGTG